MGSGPAVKIAALNKRFSEGARGSFALHDINLDVGGGEIVVVVGPSGCGKSTLLRCLAGVETYHGQINIGDRERGEVKPRELRCEWLPQMVAETFLPQQTLMQNLTLSSRLRGEPPPSEVERRKAAASFKIDQLLGRRPSEVSGGEIQRAALCRAMLTSPALLLLDEPLTGIDEQQRAGIRTLILDAHKVHSATTFCVSHDVEDALWLADRCVVMNEGRIEQVGKPRSLMDDPQTVFTLSFFGAPEVNLIEASAASGLRRPREATAMVRARDLTAVVSDSQPPGPGILLISHAVCEDQRWMGDHFRVVAVSAAGGSRYIATAAHPIVGDLDLYAPHGAIFVFDEGGRRIRNDPL